MMNRVYNGRAKPSKYGRPIWVAKISMKPGDLIPRRWRHKLTKEAQARFQKIRKIEDL
jgi:hypothetical protein